MRAAQDRDISDLPRACWTLARGGSTHVTIRHDAAHAGRWRVVDQHTSRFVTTRRMLDVGVVDQHTSRFVTTRRILDVGVVDQHTSRFVTTRRMLDVGAWWINTRHDSSRRGACWTLARGGSTHITIRHDAAHAGRWRVVDQHTSRFVTTHQYHLICAAS
jgi:hypothetical protein